MEKFKDKTIFITGASSGIGLALAKAFAEEGANLALFARRKDRLQVLAAELHEKTGCQTVIVEGDVTQEKDLHEAVKNTVERLGRIDVVIANAGFGVAAGFDKLRVPDFRRQMETNVFGLLETAYASLEELKKSKGTLVLIGSVAGYISLPGAAPYAMSKAAVHALAGSIYYEMKKHGISVVLIAPGFVDSEIRQVDNQGNLQTEAPDPIPKWLRMPTETAARQILREVYAKRKEAIITFHGKIAVYVKRHFPIFIHWILSRGLRGRPEPSSKVMNQGLKPQK